jgi:hypothetical protein
MSITETWREARNDFSALPRKTKAVMRLGARVMNVQAATAVIAAGAGNYRTAGIFASLAAWMAIETYNVFLRGRDASRHTLG